MSTFACPVHTFSRWGGEHRNCSDAHCGNHSIIGHLLCTRADGIFLRQVLTAAPRGGSHCYPILEINRDTKELGMGGGSDACAGIPKSEFFSYTNHFLSKPARRCLYSMGHLDKLKKKKIILKFMERTGRALYSPTGPCAAWPPHQPGSTWVCSPTDERT